MKLDRKLWIDDYGTPIVTFSPNGEHDPQRWGWVEAVAVPKDNEVYLAKVLQEFGFWIDKESGHIVLINTWDGEKANVLLKDTSSNVYSSNVYGYFGGGWDDADEAVTRWRDSINQKDRDKDA